MRFFIVITCFLFSFSTIAAMKKEKYFKPSIFEVTPVNSPVKESVAKFRLKLPAGFEVDKVQVKIKDAKDIFDRKQPKFESSEVTNNILSVNVSRLPPGFYRLYVKVWDKKNKSEHDFKTKFHEYVRFVIDESLQVPLPDPKKNNETIAGIDSDNNGIRDDIQRYINESYSNEPLVKLGLRQYATAMQNTLITADNKVENIAAAHVALKAIDCLIATMGLKPAEERKKLLQVKFLNTENRLIAEKKSDLNFGGQIVVLTNNQESFCQFNIE